MNRAQCPACNNLLLLKVETHYTGPFHCEHCSTDLMVAPTYLRLVYFATMPVAFELLRLGIGFRSCLSWVLFLPTNIVLAVYVLKALAHFWPPPLVRAYRYEYVTTLKLNGSADEAKWGRK